MPHNKVLGKKKQKTTTEGCCQRVLMYHCLTCRSCPTFLNKTSSKKRYPSVKIITEVTRDPTPHIPLDQCHIGGTA